MSACFPPATPWGSPACCYPEPWCMPVDPFTSGSLPRPRPDPFLWLSRTVPASSRSAPRESTAFPSTCDPCRLSTYARTGSVQSSSRHLCALPRDEAHWASVLHQHGSNACPGCVRAHGAGPLRVRYAEDHAAEELRFQRPKGLLLTCAPLQAGVLAGRVREGKRDLGTVPNEPSMQVYDAQKRPHLPDMAACLCPPAADRQGACRRALARTSFQGLPGRRAARPTVAQCRPSCRRSGAR